MTVPYVNLSHSQLADLASMRIDSRYVEAYKYMRDIVHDERIQTTDTGRSYDLLKLENWLDRAASINGNDGSFSSEFVRGATEGIRERLGNPLSEGEFQAASDALADKVLNDVLDGFGIPSIKDIIKDDVAQAVGKISDGGLGLPGWGWAGTWGDVFPPPLGLGGDYQTIPLDSVRDYAKNWMDSAGSQLIDGFGRALLPNWGHFDNFIDGSDLFGINDINYNPMGDVDVISPTVGTTPDPLVKTIVYVDPLVFDLDGDGLEITPLSKGVLFDANGDAVKTGTAWVGSDDGLLVWDRNGNGTIDAGAELFGDETLLANGEKATHGFAALSELDTGSLVDGITVGAGDGVFDAQDAQYNTLRIWRDLNQDGVSQANELQTLAQSGVRGISLASRTDNTNYGDAILAQSGSFTRTDGSTGQAGSFILAQNNFAREFVPITVSDAAKALLDLKGSGWVRDFRQAGSVREFA